MAQNNAIQFQQLSHGTPELKHLDVFIGRWINEGYALETTGTPTVKITTSDVYEWLPGRFFVLHTAYGRIGDMDAGGVEIIGYDPTTKKYFSSFFDSNGNLYHAELIVNGDSWTWKGKTHGCTAVFTQNGKLQTAHHIRNDRPVVADYTKELMDLLAKDRRGDVVALAMRAFGASSEAVAGTNLSKEPSRSATMYAAELA